MRWTLSIKRLQYPSILSYTLNMFCSLITCSTCKNTTPEIKKPILVKKCQIWESKRWKQWSYAKQSSFMMTHLQKLKNIGTSLFASNFTLILKNREARESETHERLEFRSLEASSRQSIQFLKQSIAFLTHITIPLFLINLLLSLSVSHNKTEREKVNDLYMWYEI